MYGNPYYNQQHRFQPIGMTNPQMTTQQYVPSITPQTTQIGLLGKSVESLDVVKAMDIPLDGSISYFPLTDGSAIVSKQLQSDGTSKMVIYKPVEEDKKDLPKYVTFEELENIINDYDFSDLQDLQDIKDDIKEIKKQLKGIKKPKED